MDGLIHLDTPFNSNAEACDEKSAWDRHRFAVHGISIRNTGKELAVTTKIQLFYHPLDNSRTTRVGFILIPSYKME
jgi:hypothetical protein